MPRLPGRAGTRSYRSSQLTHDALERPAVSIPRRVVVWSDVTGQRRQVAVVPGRGIMFGTKPGQVLAFGLPGGLVFLLAWAAVLTEVGRGDFPSPVPDVWLLPVLAAGWLVWGLGAFLFVRLVARSLSDLATPPLTIAGAVVYLDSEPGDGEVEPSYYVAVDDGTADSITRYKVDDRTHSRLRLGNWVRMEVTPRLSAVLRADVVPPPPGSPGRSAPSE